MKPLVIYHDHCTDGFGAAFAAWLKLGDEAEYHASQYGTKQDFLELDVVDREVYILDFSFPREVMNYTFMHAKRVVWLDHHKSAFEMWCGKYEKGMTWLEGGVDFRHIILDDNKSGALLAWEYFHPDTEVPMLIQHIDDRDRWQFKLAGSKELHAALASHKPWSFEQWSYYIEDEFPESDDVTVNALITEGCSILHAQDAAVASVVKNARKCDIIPAIINSKDSYEPPWTWNDRDQCHAAGLAVNCPLHTSEIGHELANQSGTYGLIWYTNDGVTAKCSLRSNGSYDVSAIAKVFGGGGHLNAAGFEVSVKTLLEWLTC